MTLAQRLLFAIGVLAVATTSTLALGVREAWRHAEEQQFSAQFDATVSRLGDEVAQEVRDLPTLLAPLCDHDPVLDAALVDLREGQLDAGRRLALSLRVVELMKAMRLDELVLATGQGEILGAGQESGLVGTQNPMLAAELRGPSQKAAIRTASGPAAIVAHCRRSNGNEMLGLYGARHLDSVLARVSAGEGLTLSLVAPSDPSRLLVGSVKMPLLGGIAITATRSRVPLSDAIGRLDQAVLGLGVATFAAALLAAALVSRGLARPIVELSEQARRIATGDPLPVEGRGGRELEELARSFNLAIADLVALRRRLAATERIAARREVARQIAHEIKNPLAPIRAAVETLRRLRARDDPAFDEYFDEASRTVLDEVARIAAIVQEFTEFARFPPPVLEPMDLERAVRDVVGLHAGHGNGAADEATGTGATPVTLRAAPVPKIVADRGQVVQVLTNLIQNAIDAVRGVPEPRVEVELGMADSGRVKIVVRDNGPGVAKEMLGRLFSPYATTKATGTGLGLAIVERIVVEHGGEIAYRAAEPRGAEFTIWLPESGPSLLPDAPPPSA